MSRREREEAEPRKWRLEEEARSCAVGAGGGTDEMEWRKIEARSWAVGVGGRNPKWRRQKIEMGKWEKGKSKIGYLYMGFIRVF